MSNVKSPRQPSFIPGRAYAIPVGVGRWFAGQVDGDKHFGIFEPEILGETDAELLPQVEAAIANSKLLYRFCTGSYSAKGGRWRNMGKMKIAVGLLDPYISGWTGQGVPVTYHKMVGNVPLNFTKENEVTEEEYDKLESSILSYQCIVWRWVERPLFGGDYAARQQQAWVTRMIAEAPHNPELRRYLMDTYPRAWPMLESL